MKQSSVSWRDYGALLKEAGKGTLSSQATQLSAAIAYYTLFSLAPLLVIAISISAFLLGERAAHGQIVAQLEQTIGRDSAQVIQDMIAHTRRAGSGLGATVLGLTLLLFGASKVFSQLQLALNEMWEIQRKKGANWNAAAKERILSLALVLVIGFLLLVSLLLSAGISIVARIAEQALPAPATILQILNLALSLGIITILFALIFRTLPSARIEWRDALVGGFVTALFFTIGKFFIALYLGRGGTASAYGAAGSVIVILLWVYYSSLILLFGAEFTQCYIRKRGDTIAPVDNAERVRRAPVLDPPSAQRAVQRISPTKRPEVSERIFLEKEVRRAAFGYKERIQGIKALARETVNIRSWARCYPKETILLAAGIGLATSVRGARGDAPSGRQPRMYSLRGPALHFLRSAALSTARELGSRRSEEISPSI